MTRYQTDPAYRARIDAIDAKMDAAVAAGVVFDDAEEVEECSHCGNPVDGDGLTIGDECCFYCKAD